VLVATALLFAVSWLFASSSLNKGVLLTMLPFASALAIAALGQTLVVMQGGIDLSVAGGFSLYVVIVTKYPAGDSARLWPAIGIAFLAAIAAGLVNGFLIGRMRLNPIVATLGTNALLFGAVLWYSAGIPTTTTRPRGLTIARLWANDPLSPTQSMTTSHPPVSWSAYAIEPVIERTRRASSSLDAVASAPSSRARRIWFG